MLMPTSCSIAPAATITSASRTLHSEVADDGRLDAALGEQAQNAQRDVGHDLDVHPAVVGHAQALGRVDAGDVPPGLELLVGVGVLDQPVELAISPRRDVNVDCGDRR